MVYTASVTQVSKSARLRLLKRVGSGEQDTSTPGVHSFHVHRRNAYLRRLRTTVCVHGRRTRVLRDEGLYKQAQPLHGLPCGAQGGPFGQRRRPRRSSRDVQSHLQPVRWRRGSTVPASRRQAGLLPRLLRDTPVVPLGPSKQPQVYEKSLPFCRLFSSLEK